MSERQRTTALADADRLRNQVGHTEGEAFAAQLLQSAPNSLASEVRQRRIWLGVRQRVTRPQLSFIRRHAVVVAMLVGLVGIASAASGYRWMYRDPLRTAQPAPSPAVSPRKSPAPQLPAPSTEPNPAAVVASTVPKVASSRAQRPQRALANRAAMPMDPSLPSASMPDGEESALMLQAVRTLRKQEQAAQAAHLLDDYLKRFAKGLFVEEAMALQIEAAMARGDTKAAAKWARSYLQRYPSGKFAEKALAIRE